MDCIKVSQHLHHYLDSELGRWRQSAVRRHLDSCAACSSGFRFESHVRQTVFAKCREDELPDGLHDRIVGALGIEPPELGGSTLPGPLGS